MAVSFITNKSRNLLGLYTLPNFTDKDVELYNKQHLLKRVNDPSAFDVDLNPKEHDRLSLFFTVKNDQYPLKYGFEYRNGKWEEEEYYDLEWQMEHERKDFGEIRAI